MVNFTSTCEKNGLYCVLLAYIMYVGIYAHICTY